MLVGAESSALVGSTVPAAASSLVWPGLGVGEPAVLKRRAASIGSYKEGASSLLVVWPGLREGEQAVLEGGAEA